MRGKKSKALRRLSQMNTVGQPDVSYDNHEPSRYQAFHPDMLSPVQYRKILPGTPLRLGCCTRKRYQEYKAVYKRLRRWRELLIF